MRRQALDRAQAAEARALAIRQQREERQAARTAAAERDRVIVESKRRFLAERSGLGFTHHGERAAIRSAWRMLPRSRRQDHGWGTPVPPRRPNQSRATDLQQTFQHAANPLVVPSHSDDNRERRLQEFRQRSVKERDRGDDGINTGSD